MEKILWLWHAARLVGFLGHHSHDDDIFRKTGTEEDRCTGRPDLEPDHWQLSGRHTPLRCIPPRRWSLVYCGRGG